MGTKFHRNHSQFHNYVAYSLLANLGLSCFSASFTITTNFSVCAEGLLLIIFQHLVLSSALCSAKSLARFISELLLLTIRKLTNFF